MIIGFPHRPGTGGPGSFQSRLENSLKDQGWTVVYANEGILPDLIMVVGGTQKLHWLWKMKKAGIPILHRLDGLAWLHRKKGYRVNNFIKGEIRNFIFHIIQNFFATYVIYQSQFVLDWWTKSSWKKNHFNKVIYNGIDLDVFHPESEINNPKVLLCVEGSLDYSPYAVGLLNYIQKELIEKSNFDALILYGGFEDSNNIKKLDSNIIWKGKVDRVSLPNIYINAVYLSLDVNAACPNTVIEAMSCGIPVVGFDTGALKELVGEGGIVTTFDGNPWKLDPPNFENIVSASKEILNNWNYFSKNARKRAEDMFDLNKITKQYIDQMLEMLT